MAEITMSERRPLEFDGRYLWHPTPAEDAYVCDQWDYLPPALFARLAGHQNAGRLSERRVKAYPSESAAMRALADALPGEQEVAAKGGGE